MTACRRAKQQETAERRNGHFTPPQLQRSQHTVAAQSRRYTVSQQFAK
jgi:hypothetical protein